MKRALLVVVSAGMVLAADAREDPAKQELEKIQGTWVLVGAEQDGKKSFPKEGEKISMRVEIKGDKYTLTAEMGKEKSSAEGTFKFDATRKPKTLDFKYEGFGRKTPVEGIYELDGDSLKVCFQIFEGEPRPKEWTTKEGSGRVVMTWKREKP